MIAIMCFVLGIVVIGAIWSWASDYGVDGFTIVLILMLVLSVVGVVYDVSSPITTTETIVLTNDYKRYGLEIESNDIGRVKKIVTDSVRKGAMWNDDYDFVFLGFEEKK